MGNPPKYKKLTSSLPAGFNNPVQKHHRDSLHIILVYYTTYAGNIKEILIIHNEFQHPKTEKGAAFRSPFMIFELFSNAYLQTPGRLPALNAFSSGH